VYLPRARSFLRGQHDGLVYPTSIDLRMSPSLALIAVSSRDTPQKPSSTLDSGVFSRAPRTIAKSHILHLIYFICRLFIWMCPDLVSVNSSPNHHTYSLKAFTASTAVSLPKQIASTRYSSTSSSAPTLPICTSLALPRNTSLM
jgi:hypothetical protein